MFSVSKKKMQQMSKLSLVSQRAVFLGTVAGSLIAFFGLTKAASATSLTVTSSFSPMLGDHVAELARMLAAPDQVGAMTSMTEHQLMMMIVSVGFLAMVAGSAAFWTTLQRDYARPSNRPSNHH